MQCPTCGYEWDKRKSSPKRCPRCQRWLPGWEPAAAAKKSDEQSAERGWTDEP